MAAGTGKTPVDGGITLYTLTSADHPGSLITHVQLKGSNLDPLPNLNRVYAMIVTKEQHRTVARNLRWPEWRVAYLA